MKAYVILFFLSGFFFGFAQDSTSVTIDDRYREDQFYASITYNLLSNNPSAISSNGFSTGYHFGFLRDMPINLRRNWSIGLGLGISTNSYNSNLIIIEDNNTVNFQEQNSSFGDVSKSKFTTYLIDIPLEIRWRTSTTTSYKFWRIYSGFKLSYLVYNSTKLRSELKDQNLSNLDIFNRFQYGLTLSAGYGTWNFHAYYGLNEIFDNTATLNGTAINSQALRIGLIFYIL